MRFRTLVLSLVVGLAVAGCSKKADNGVTAPGSPVAAVTPPAGKAWSDVVSTTPEGGVRMGNPDAAVKLVEYASFTCPHCAKFAADGADALRQRYVDTGKVSWEFRAVTIHGALDVPLILLMNCRPPDVYFPIAEQLFADQSAMLDKVQAKLTSAEQQRLQALPPADQFKAVADDAGMYAFFGQRGLPRAKAEQCLADQKATDALTANQQRYTTVDNITGTPTFFVNGQMQDGLTTWAQLEPRLKAATGG